MAAPAVADNSGAMLSIIRKHGQACVKCGKALAQGSVVTWSRDKEQRGWICVEGENACSPRDPEVIEAKKSGKYQPAGDFNQLLNGNKAVEAEAELQKDVVFPFAPEKPKTTTTASQTSDGQTNNLSSSDPLAVLASAMVPHLEAKLRTKVDEDRVNDLIENAIAQATEQLRQMFKPVHCIEVRMPNGAVNKVDGAHPKLEEALQFLTLGDNVYIWGPPGAGKTHAAKQIADALGARFVPFQAGKLSTESLLRAFVDAHGKIQDATFMEAYQSDDVLIFLDEFDRWPTHLQVLLNTALANGYLQSRIGDVPRGRNYILAAGNTNLRGRDEYFPEAQAAEFSTLDRFTVVYWPYDEDHEDSIALAINPNAKPWLAWVRRIRPEALSGKRGKILATPRAMYQGSKALRYTRLTVEAIADAYVFKGVAKETRNAMLASYPLPVIPASQREAKEVN